MYWRFSINSLFFNSYISLAEIKKRSNPLELFVQIIGNFSPLQSFLILSWSGIKHVQILFLIGCIKKNLSRNGNIQIIFLFGSMMYQKKKTWPPLAICFWLAETKNLLRNYRSIWFVTLYKCIFKFIYNHSLFNLVKGKSMCSFGLRNCKLAWTWTETVSL